MTIVINSPTPSASVSGTISIGFTVTNTYNVVGGSSASVSASASVSLNTTTLSNGPKTIVVQGGGQSAQLAVIVANPVLTASPDGATIPSNTQLVDTALNIWTVSAGVVYKNSLTAGFTASVTQLLWYGGVIWQENVNGLWWPWNGTTWTGAGVADPRTPAGMPFYGVAGHYVQGGIYSTNISAQVADMVALGIKTIGQDCYSMNDTSKMVALVTQFAPIIVQPGFNQYPASGASETSSYNKFHSIGVAVANQLAGKVPVIGTMNEPENFYFTNFSSNNGQAITDWSANQGQWGAFRGAVRGFTEGFRSIDTTKQTLLASPSVSWLHYGILDGLWNGVSPDGTTGHPTVRWDLTSQHWYYDMDDITNAGNTNTNVLTTLQTLFGVPTSLSEIGVQFTESEGTITSYISNIVGFYASAAAAYNIAGISWYELYNFDNNGGFLMGLYSAQGTQNAGRASAMAAVIAAHPK